MTRLQAGRKNALALQVGADNRSESELAPGDLKARTEAAAAVAAAHAARVDRDARFPEEAITAVRAQRLLGIMVPREFGGEGAGLSDVVDVCYGLGRACSSTAMIYAMHQIMVACVLRHRGNNVWHERLLRRLCAEQLLLASSTTEGKGGGNVRSSEAPIELARRRQTAPADGRRAGARRRCLRPLPLTRGSGGAPALRFPSGSGSGGSLQGRIPQHNRLQPAAGERIQTRHQPPGRNRRMGRRGVAN